MNFTGESEKKKYLIISRVGDSSLHPSWLEPREFCTFDLCLIYYGEQPGRYARDSHYYTENKGDKWTAIRKAVQSFGKDLLQYEAIWMPDEHVRSNAFTISQMFHLFSEQGLWLAQPALAGDSPVSMLAHQQHPEFILRYVVRFGSMLAPLFSPRALKACSGSMGRGGSTAGDQAFHWPGRLELTKGRMAVIDATPVRYMPVDAAVGAPAGSEAPQETAGELMMEEASQEANANQDQPEEHEALDAAEEQGISVPAPGVPTGRLRPVSPLYRRRRSRKKAGTARSRKKKAGGVGKLAAKRKLMTKRNKKPKLAVLKKQAVRPPKPLLKTKVKKKSGKSKKPAA